MEWTPAFCRKDSDDDGLTNGDELGDGCCDGSGANAQVLSHPGLGDGDCGALPCRSDKPSCGATSVAGSVAESLRRSMSVEVSHSVVALSDSNQVSLTWSPPPPFVCACAIVIRAGQHLGFTSKPHSRFLYFDKV